MSAASGLYLAAPLWLQNVAVTAYGWRLRYVRYGSLQRRTLRDLRRTQWQSAEEILAGQLARLSALVAHARAAVPFYRDLDAPPHFASLAQLRELPMVRKADLRAPRARIVAAPYRARRLVEIHTGGTTGTPLTVYCDRATLQRNYAFFARLREWAGIPRGARVATFAGRTLVPPRQSAPPFWRWNLAANTLLLSSYHIAPDTVPAYAAALARWRPQLIDSYPSSLVPIARYLLTAGGADAGRIRPSAVITSSETLTLDARAVIEEAFGCPVFDHYGAAEMAALITQCERGTYHVNPEFGVVELVRDGRPVEEPGEPGEIVATGFINPVMPLIRYATGDVAAWAAGSCSCGRAFPAIERIEGRMDDVLVTPEGRRIGRLDPVFKAVSSLHETRIVQDAPDHVRVEIVARGELPTAERAALLRELRNRLGPSMRIDLQPVAAIPRTPGGKLRAVIRSGTWAPHEMHVVVPDEVELGLRDRLGAAPNGGDLV